MDIRYLHMIILSDARQFFRFRRIDSYAVQLFSLNYYLFFAI